MKKIFFRVKLHHNRMLNLTMPISAWN